VRMQLMEQKALDMLITQAKIVDEDPAATNDRLIVTPEEARAEGQSEKKKRK